MGYETVSYNSVQNYHTPNIDQLAREGYVFTNCDSQPLCCPTRIKLMSGQLNYRNYTGWGSFKLEFPAIGKIIKQAGYATGVFGKWHMNKSAEELGFDEHCIFLGGPKKMPYHEFFKRYYYNCPVLEDGKNIFVDYSPHKFNQRVLKFIDDHKKKPFFIYYPLSLSHNPFEPTPDSRDPESKVWKSNFEDMVAYADKMIGNVIKKLKKEELYDNTIIFYTADNGTKTLPHYMKNGEIIFGGKGTMRVDGVHVPLIVKYDGSHKVMDDLIDFTDFYPTLASVAGIDINTLSDLRDGTSFHPLLKNQIRDSKEYIFSVFLHNPLNAYIRDKEYKYYPDGRLYNIIKDPRELQPYYSLNDTKESVEARKRLTKELRRLLTETELSGYPAKDKIINTFGDIGSKRDNNWMIRAYIFDRLEYTPRKEKITVDITDFLTEEGKNYNIEFSRAHRSKNSGLTYADVTIKNIKVNNNDNLIYSADSLELGMTTRRDVNMLREKGNPIISFIKEGDFSKVPLGNISRPTTGRIKVEIEIDVANPDNQYGEQAMLYIYLNRDDG